MSLSDFRDDLRPRPDYFANPSLQPTCYGWLRQPTHAAELKRWASRRNREPIVECTDVRWTESSSERKRRIRLRHVATGSDLVAFLERVSLRLRLPVA